MAHITNIPYINSSNIDYYMGCLNQALHLKYANNIQQFNILIVGGSALALKYSYRGTVDIDADIRFQSEITSCINYVAESNNIPKDWLNQDFTKSDSYSFRLWTNAIYYKTIGFINIYIVSDLDQLCMKLIAGRNKDISDSIFLCNNLIRNNIRYSDLIKELDYLYGDYIKPKKKLLARVNKMFKKANLL